jgi:hypothetical protein
MEVRKINPEPCAELVSASGLVSGSQLMLTRKKSRKEMLK